MHFSCRQEEEAFYSSVEIEGGTTARERTKEVDRLHKKHPGTRRQRSSHGAGRYSVQFFDKATGKLVADYNLS